MAKTLIYNGRVLNETGYIQNGFVLFDGQKIISVGKGVPDDLLDLPGIEAIDAENMIISPGFIDMHTHGIMDIDFMQAAVPDIQRAFYEYPRFGVTRVVGSTLSNPIENIIRQIGRFREAVESSDAGAVFHGAHVEGPWLAPRCRGGHALEYLKHPEKPDVERLLGETGGMIKTLTFAPELNNSVWLTEQLVREDIVPVMGHTEASFEDAEKVIHAGARHVTHMYDTTLGYRENPDEALVMMPGMETAALYHDEVSIELIGCPVHVPKPFFKFINKIKPPDKRVVVTDSLVGTGKPEGTVLTYEDGRQVYVEAGVLRMIDKDPKVNGNLTGSAVTMNTALKRLTAYTELPVSEAVRWGSLNPATTLGIQGKTGSIKNGKYADIVIMDDSFDIKMTFVKGRKLWESME
jgi:N-acetylglucosamine-6-phosphate deacetylase